jgi:hypothetical protein
MFKVLFIFFILTTGSVAGAAIMAAMISISVYSNIDSTLDKLRSNRFVERFIKPIWA